MKPSKVPPVVTGLVLVFLYVPLAIVAVQSVNRSRYGSRWDGFTFAWYAKLWADDAIWLALKHTLLVAGGATLASVVLGTGLALSLNKHRTRWQLPLTYLPLVVPDLLIGLCLLLFFLSLGLPLGLGTITLAHTSFCISYVAMVVLARLQGFDPRLLDAARDLGAGPWLSFRRVVLPYIWPGIVAGGLLAFTLSVDDYVIAFFVAGPGSGTLPLRIYSMIKFGAPPVLHALSTLLVVFAFLAAAFFQRLGGGEETP